MAGVQLVNDLASFARPESRKLSRPDKNVKRNEWQTEPNSPWSGIGSLSRDKYFSNEPGSKTFKDKLEDFNNAGLDYSRNFVTPDDTGMRPADYAMDKWRNLALESWPNPKVGPFAERPDFYDVESFYGAYTDSLLVNDEDFVSGPTTLAHMFQPATIASAENSGEVAGKFPSQDV